MRKRKEKDSKAKDWELKGEGIAFVGKRYQGLKNCAFFRLWFLFSTKANLFYEDDRTKHTIESKVVGALAHLR
jgi:hypothetical protein